MTAKQKIRSLEQKLKRIEKNNPKIDFELTGRNFYFVEKHFIISNELFDLKFQVEHCEKCGKKY